MKIVVFSGHGVFSPAHATTHMMLRYLHSLCSDVTQLVCDGAFSVCERDIEFSSTKRTLDHCLQCQSEQEGFAAFSGARTRTINDFLTPDDLVRTREWMLSHDPEALYNTDWYGISIKELVEKSFQRFTKQGSPRFSNKQHSALVKQLALAGVRMTVAGGKCINQIRPDWLWVPSGQELLTKSLSLSISQRISGMPNMQVVKFSAPVEATAAQSQIILAERSGDSQPYKLPSIVDSLTDVRSDIESWPKEVVAEFDQFFSYLGISDSQLSLPVAR